MKFEVGQKWRDRTGDIWQIVDVCKKDEDDFFHVAVKDLFPVVAVKEGNTKQEYFTTQGYFSTHKTKTDLVELVPTMKPLTSETRPEENKVNRINFWEAREAAKQGKYVKMVRDTDPTGISPKDMLGPSRWENIHLDADWEIVEEPKHKTCYINVYLHNVCPWDAHDTQSGADSGASKDRVSCIAITVDENGKLVEAKNV